VTGGAEDSVPEQVRAACAWVTSRARFVQIEEAELRAYAAALPSAVDPPPLDAATDLVEAVGEARAAFIICLDAINFGSGWWPTIRKRPGRSGYFTIAVGLTERFRERGPWPAAELSVIGAGEIAAVLDQDVNHPLLADFAATLRDVGAHVEDQHGGRFASVIEAANGSAVALADLLASWRAFADLVRLTALADNLVPHVLRLAPDLEQRIEAGELLEHGSPEEVELRACAVHAVELLSAATQLSPAAIDAVLWNRGASERYKSVPRPRSRNTAY
jgi:hypothetical protein